MASLGLSAALIVALSVLAALTTYGGKQAGWWLQAAKVTQQSQPALRDEITRNIANYYLFLGQADVMSDQKDKDAMLNDAQAAATVVCADAPLVTSLTDNQKQFVADNCETKHAALAGHGN